MATTIGFLLRTKNLDRMRVFYRDLLGLGAPVTDSGFWVEFRAGEGIRIILEKVEADYLEHQASALALIINTDEIENIFNRLRANSYRIEPINETAGAEFFWRVLDPDENVIRFVPPADWEPPTAPGKKLPGTITTHLKTI